jgi:hypothetical protein
MTGSVIVITGVMLSGKSTIVQDVILGPDLCAYQKLIRTRPCHLVVLRPRPEVVAAREAARRKTGYRDWTIEAWPPAGAGAGSGAGYDMFRTGTGVSSRSWDATATRSRRSPGR